MNNYRIFVEKRPLYRVEAESMRRELNEHLGLEMGELRLLNVYDLFGFLLHWQVDSLPPAPPGKHGLSQFL